MNTLYWHDYETTGIDPARDRPIQFAGVRTDENLDRVGEPLTLYCRLTRDVLPHPQACLITGITPQVAMREGLNEPDFIDRIHRELSAPGTCGVGYNSLRFDDEVTRYTLYRNFYDPYEREWRNGNSRWDIIDMLRLTRALRPRGIQWPDGEDGAPSFRLELLTAANGIRHEAAHDAMSDVYATLAMARLVRSHQPRLYQYVYDHRVKHKVAGLIDLANRKPFLHVSGRLPRENGYLALMAPLCQHPVNKNAVVSFNLMQDPDILENLDSEQIRDRLFTRNEDLEEGRERIALKAVHLNRCPVVATPKLLDAESARRLGIDLERCERHWQRLRTLDVTAKLHRVFQRPAETGPGDVDAALYEGFIPDADKALLARIRGAAPEQLSGGFPFTDRRFNELLFRYRARHFPDTLSDTEAHDWEEYRYHVLMEPPPGRLGLEGYFAELDRLESATTRDRDREVLNALRAWGESLTV
ncbi:MAG: exodeoxyribonuclease I [Porticoccaceae bacterium]|nr:exodeoxyribonuclease I [Porticoccaceae bacterium]